MKTALDVSVLCGFYVYFFGSFFMSLNKRVRFSANVLLPNNLCKYF